MSVTIRPVCSRADLKKFIHLPARIHKDHSNWIPPLYSDEWVYFDSKKNKAFQHCDTILLLAYRGNEVVGRIMGIISYTYNEAHKENHARFNYLEAWDDREVIEALVSHVEEWARLKGMDKIVGPLAFSDKDPQGYLVEGFNQPVVIASHCNFPYIIEHLKDMGYDKEIDLVVYHVPIPDALPELYAKIADRAMRQKGELQLRIFTRRKDLKPLIRPVFELVNKTFTEIYGFDPFTLEEMDDFANRYLIILDPKFIKLIQNETGEVISFVIGMPDISKGIKRSRGYLFPFGIFHILWARNHTKQLNLLLGAIREDYRGKGLDTVMGKAMMESAHEAGLEYIDSHLEMEQNTKVRAEMEHMGGKVYKTYRIFQKALLEQPDKARSAAMEEALTKSC
ncbi:MAG: hypothetical protein ACOYXB_12210 [Bacteroidota bacterium]